MPKPPLLARTEGKGGTKMEKSIAKATRGGRVREGKKDETKKRQEKKSRRRERRTKEKKIQWESC